MHTYQHHSGEEKPHETPVQERPREDLTHPKELEAVERRDETGSYQTSP